MSNEISNERLELAAKNGVAIEETVMAMAKELLALRKAFSDPVAYTAKSNLDGFGGSVGYMWPPGNEKKNDVALYLKPEPPC